MHWKVWLILFSASFLSITVFAFYKGALDRQRPQDKALAADAREPILSIDGQPLVTFLDPSIGPADAKNLIIEYGDYACPFCQEAEHDVQQLMERHPGKIRFVWKDAPNSLHFGADVAAEAGQCAHAQGRFWEYHERIFDSGGLLNSIKLSLVANELGLDEDAFGRCLSNHEKLPLVERTVEEARALGVDGTPYFFINGKRFSGQPTYAEFESALSL